MEQKELLQEKIERYGDMLYKLAFSQMKNRQDAEDVVQEVFYKFVKNEKAFASQEHEKAWLIRVTLNTCRKIWRSAWYKHSTPFASHTQAAALDSGAEQKILEKEREKEVFEAVLLLPRKYREVIHLFYFEGMSIQEICEVTGRKTNTVTSQLTRAREQLKKMLKEAYQYE